MATPDAVVAGSPAAPPPWARRETVALGATLALTLASRVLVLRHALALPRVTMYLVLAERRAAGTMPPERLLDFSPLYGALATLARLAGVDVALSLLVLQLISGVALAAVAFAVGRRAAGLGGGVAAALLFAAAPVPAVCGAALVPETTVALLLLAGTCVLWRPGIGWRGALVAGALLGLAALTRPNALLATLLAAALLWRRPRVASAQLGAALAVLLAGLGLWLGGAGVPVRHWPALMSSGQLFHMGNGPGASGVGYSSPLSVHRTVPLAADGVADVSHRAYRVVARAAAGSCLAPPAAEAYWRGLARAEIRRRPLAALRRVGRSLHATLYREPNWDLPGGAALLAAVRPLVPASTTLLLPLALLGATLGRRRALLPLLPPLAIALLTPLLFLADARPRALLEAALAPAAGAGLLALLAAWRGERTVSRAVFGVATAVALLLAVVSALPDAAIRANLREAALERGGEQVLTSALARWQRGASPSQVEEMLAAALVAAPQLEDRLPAALRTDALAGTIAQRARAVLARGTLQERRAAAGALVFLADDCPAYLATLPPSGTTDDVLGVLAGRCHLQQHDLAGARQALARLDPPPLDAQALTMAVRVAGGEPMGRAMGAFTHEEDPLSELLAAESALRAAHEDRLADAAGRVFRTRVERALACTPRP